MILTEVDKNQSTLLLFCFLGPDPAVPESITVPGAGVGVERERPRGHLHPRPPHAEPRHVHVVQRRPVRVAQQRRVPDVPGLTGGTQPEK